MTALAAASKMLIQRSELKKNTFFIACPRIVSRDFLDGSSPKSLRAVPEIILRGVGCNTFFVLRVVVVIKSYVLGVVGS